MKTFQTIKEELKKERQNTKYFNKQFFAIYNEALETIKRNNEKGIDDSYNDNGIWTRHAWDEVRKTDFYQKNSCAYCTFLQIVA